MSADVDAILAAEAMRARDLLVHLNPKNPYVWLGGYFNSIARDYPETRSDASRQRFIELATASAHGEC